MHNIKKKLLVTIISLGVGLASFSATAKIIKCDRCTCSGDGICVCSGCS